MSSPFKPLKLTLFAPFQLWIDGRPIKQFRTYKIRDLLIYLAANPNVPHARHRLAALFWSDYPDQVARTNLRNALSQLRKILAPLLVADQALLVSTHQIIQLNLTAENHESDLYTIEREWASLQSHDHRAGLLCPSCVRGLNDIVALYQRGFLSELSQIDQALFETWRLQKQEAFQELIGEVYQILSHHYRLQGEYGRAEQFIRRQLDLAPWLEKGHQALMEVLALSGQRAAALAQYEKCRQLLESELAVPPSAETEQLYEQIRDGLFTQPEQAQRGQAQIDSVLNNLPVALTPFFGRESEIEQINRLLGNPLYRIISLVGSGGIGKTRLALTAAGQSLSNFADGVWFVPLAGLDGDQAADDVARHVATAVAEALQLHFYDNDSPQSQLLAYLRQKSLLLVLDNFEHLLPHIDLITQIHKQAPQVFLLITSREQLNLQAEYILSVEGLSVPNLAHASTALSDNPALSYSSVQLFIERAARTRRGFTLNRENQHTVIQICRFLEGLPLGIELAAAWIKMMNCDEIAQEMGRNLDFLTSTQRDVSARHRSLRAVFDHSWHMLTKQEQLTLSQLSVFRGNFTREAVRAVTERDSVVLIGGLVDKSLLHVSASGRYQLHELVRQFAAEQLASWPSDIGSEGVERQTAAQHTSFYLTFVQQRGDLLDSPGAQKALVQIQEEVENIRAAWRWAVSNLQLDLIEQSLEALLSAYNLMGLFDEGVIACEMVTKRLIVPPQTAVQLEPKQQRLLGNLLIKQALFLNSQTKAEQAILTVQASLELGRNIQSPQLIAKSHYMWGAALTNQGKYEEAQIQAFQGIAQAGDGFLEAKADNLIILSNIYFDQGDFTRASEYDQQALGIFESSGNSRRAAGTLSNLGHVTTLLGNYVQAKTHLERALQIRRNMGDRQGEATSLENLGNLYYRLEKYGLAQQYFETALSIYEQTHHKEGVGYALTYMGCVALGRGELELAAKRFTQAYHVRQETGQMHLVSEDQAGLAEVALRQGDLGRAQAEVEKILEYMSDHTLKGEDLFRVYLTCYRVLKAGDDGRATQVLQTAYDLLNKQTEKIESAALRYSFINNVTFHRDVIREWEEAHRGQ